MVDAFALQGMSFLLSGPPTIFTDDSLPTSLDLTDFTQQSASLEFTNGMIGPQVSALVESLTVTVTVPEPATLALLALAGAAMAAVLPDPLHEQEPSCRRQLRDRMESHLRVLLSAG